MGIKQRLVPASVARAVRNRRRNKELLELPSVDCNAEPLRPVSQVELSALLPESREMTERWEQSKREIDQLAIPDGTGGVNLGDRRAIYYLTSMLDPSSVLEVGTLIGASTLNMASALAANRKEGERQADLVTVDIADVNCPTKKPWLTYDAKSSPIEMVNSMGYGESVEFITDQSLDYFAKCERRFDLIFLDGDHSAKTVYQEVPAALKLLSPNGVILLHDFFPDLKPLWSNGSVIPGPNLAIKRLVSEGAKLAVLPLGELAWPTKLNSNVTSLALLLRQD